MGFEAGVWSCEICGKQVTRLLGMAGGVESPAGGAQIRPVVRGYCALHREAVRQAFQEELEAFGEVTWLGKPDVDLRPRNAFAWLQRVDQELGSAMADGRGLVETRDGSCPHCGADVGWDSGPHVSDAALRPGGVAWECAGCGAAGVAYVLR